MKTPTAWIKRLTATTVLGVAVTAGVNINEGYSEHAYYDSAGIATICYGETKGVKIGQTHTKDQCDKQLQESLESHAVVFNGVPLSTPDVVALGVIDMAYNVGVNGFNASKAKKAIIAGDYKLASQYVLEWRFITITKHGKKVKYDCSTPGNKVCYGLWKRRQWQSKAIGNQFKTPQEAIDELNQLYR